MTRMKSKPDFSVRVMLQNRAFQKKTLQVVFMGVWTSLVGFPRIELRLNIPQLTQLPRLIMYLAKHLMMSSCPAAFVRGCSTAKNVTCRCAGVGWILPISCAQDGVQDEQQYVGSREQHPVQLEPVLCERPHENLLRIHELQQEHCKQCQEHDEPHKSFQVGSKRCSLDSHSRAFGSACVATAICAARVCSLQVYELLSLGVSFILLHLWVLQRPSISLRWEVALFTTNLAVQTIILTGSVGGEHCCLRILPRIELLH